MIRTILLTLLTLHMLCSFTISQELTGSLQGIVTDNSGKCMTNVNVILSCNFLLGQRGTSTNPVGKFNFLYLPPGHYKLEISHIGFTTKIINKIAIKLGVISNLGKIVLEQESIDLKEIIVSDEGNSLDPTSTIIGGNLQLSNFRNLPINRDYKSAISVLPQVNSSYFGDQVNIAGATGFANKYFVDGVEVTDPLAGRDGTRLPYNFIKEIQVLGGGYQADKRSALGGIINVITHSGSNYFQTSAFGFFTSNGFSKYERLGFNDPSQAEFKDYDFGISFSGPLISDELWYFVAYNPSFYIKEVDVPNFGKYVDKTIINSLAVKINWKASSKLNFAFTLTGDPTKRNTVGRNIGVPPAELLSADSYLQDLTEGGINYSLNAIYRLNPNIYFQGSVDHVTRHDTGEPSTNFGKENVFFVDEANRIWSGGPTSNWDSYRFKTNLNLNGTYLIGDQTLKVGFEYKDNGVRNNYSYRGIQKFNENFYGEYKGKGFGEVHSRILSLYINDSWAITNNLNVSFGLRYDSQKIIGSDKKVAQNIELPLQPRIGISYLFGKKFEHKIYASYGCYSQELAVFQSVNFHNHNGYDYYFLYNHDPRENSAGADTVRNIQHIIYPEIDGLKGQYYNEFSVGYETNILENLQISIQGVHRNLLSTIDNVYFEERNYFILGNPGRGELSEWPKPVKEYSAFILSVEHFLSEKLYFLGSYTLSRNYGNYGGLFEAFNHAEFPNESSSFNDLETALENATGLLPNDRTHSFKFSGFYKFLYGINAGITFTAQSGTPLSEYESTKRGIKFITKRGSAGRTDFIWDLNLRLSYNIQNIFFNRLRVIADIFHIASQRKAVDIDQQKYKFNGEGIPSIPNPTYGKAYRYQPPMSVRLGIEVNIL